METITICRGCYQSSIWITSHLSIQNVPAPNEWGRTDDVQCGWLPIWMTIPETARTCSELIKVWLQIQKRMQKLQMCQNWATLY